MSRRRNCYDTLWRNFFSTLKAECIYRHLPATFDKAKTLIDNYIYFYNHQRIQLKTGVAPHALRHSD
ncbi:MAG: IS3 family transposase [Oscillospiraceae bacterium]|nr:IS3 family transposase [Oscillospiraceae bacterium]